MRLDEADARTRFAEAQVARLATVTPSGRPHVVPVTFAVTGDTIVTAVDTKPKTTRDLARLRNIQANPAVALLVDHYAGDWESLWWVRADGRAEVVEEPVDVAAVTALHDKYSQYRAQPPEGPYIVVTVRRWTGWAAK